MSTIDAVTPGKKVVEFWRQRISVVQGTAVVNSQVFAGNVLAVLHSPGKLPPA